MERFFYDVKHKKKQDILAQNVKMNILKGGMSTNKNSTASTGLKDFYVTRPFNKNINVFKKPKQLIAVAADIGHRFFKIGNDILRLYQGKNRKPLADLSSSSTVRTKESTLGALQNMIGGLSAISKGKYVAGSVKIADGLLGVFDIIPSIVTDALHIATGVTQSRTAANNSKK